MSLFLSVSFHFSLFLPGSAPFFLFLSVSVFSVRFCTIWSVSVSLSVPSFLGRSSKMLARSIQIFLNIYFFFAGDGWGAGPQLFFIGGGGNIFVYIYFFGSKTFKEVLVVQTSRRTNL